LKQIIDSGQMREDKACQALISASLHVDSAAETAEEAAQYLSEEVYLSDEDKVALAKLKEEKE
jgi:hypothetical protein